MLKSVTGEQLSSVSQSDLEAAGSKDVIPGQIPFYQFEESELESFDPENVSTRVAKIAYPVFYHF